MCHSTEPIAQYKSNFNRFIIKKCPFNPTAEFCFVLFSCRWGLKYLDCISGRMVRFFTFRKKRYLEFINVQFWGFGGVNSTPSLLLLPNQLWPGVLVHVKVQAMAEIKLFANYLYFTGIYMTVCQKLLRNINTEKCTHKHTMYAVFLLLALK